MSQITSELYEQDFNLWIHENIKSLKNGDFNSCDIDNIIEELEGVSAREIRELRSRLIVLIAHLLKWKYQDEYRSKSWRNTIAVQRNEIEALLEDSPSLKPKARDILHDDNTKKRVIDLFIRETGLSANLVKNGIEFTLDQILDSKFFPENEK